MLAQQGALEAGRGNDSCAGLGVVKPGVPEQLGSSNSEDKINIDHALQNFQYARR